MDVLVQKFGGTSVASSDSREYVYEKIEKAVDMGKSLVVVISAMGRKGDPYATDTLLNLFYDDNKDAGDRERDMIFSCGEIISGCVIVSNLQKRGHKAVFLTGQQAGIITEGEHLSAKVIRVDTEKIEGLLKEGYIIVVAGSQGASEDGEITSLGRGGSDITAGILGAYLKADKVEIYTDVDGIMTGDPKHIQKASVIPLISYRNCLEMASNGASIIHPRAVKAAMDSGKVDLLIKSTFTDSPGTLITRKDLKKQFREIFAITESENLDLIKTTAVANERYEDIIKHLEKFKHIAGFSSYRERDHLFFITPKALTFKLENLLREEGIAFSTDRDMVDIKLIGENLSDCQYASKVMDTLSENNIKAASTYCADSFIRVVVPEEKGFGTLNLLHQSFLAI